MCEDLLPSASELRTTGEPLALTVKYLGRTYKVHRIAWKLVHGELSPDVQVDHRNCDPFDNRLDNLRLADATGQMANRRITKNKTTFKGVSKKSNGRPGFQAEIMVARRKIYLGTFSTTEEAHAAYRQAAIQHFGEFARA